MSACSASLLLHAPHHLPAYLPTPQLPNQPLSKPHSTFSPWKINQEPLNTISDRFESNIFLHFLKIPPLSKLMFCSLPSPLSLLYLCKMGRGAGWGEMHCSLSSTLLCPCSVVKWMVGMVSVWPRGMQAEESTKAQRDKGQWRVEESDLSSRAWLSFVKWDRKPIIRRQCCGWNFQISNPSWAPWSHPPVHQAVTPTMIKMSERCSIFNRPGFSLLDSCA